MKALSHIIPSRHCLAIRGAGCVKPEEKEILFLQLVCLVRWIEQPFQKSSLF
jgi:hypothetical protein